MKRFLVGLLAALALAAPATSAAKGGTYVCTGTIGLGPLFGQYTPSTIDANVFVPAGATCALYVTTVTGNVNVQGTLLGFGNTFQKNVVVDGGQVFFPICLSGLCGGLPQNHVLGNTIVNDASGSISLSAQLDGNVIVNGVAGDVLMIFAGAHGNKVLLSGVTGDAIVQASFIDGDLSLIGNGPGQSDVVNAIIAGTLDCEADDPAPAVFGVTAGDRRGQCADEV